MALVTVAAAGKKRLFPVVAGRMVFPRVGAWHMDIEADAPSALSGKVDIAVGSRELLKGTVVRGAMYEGLWRARVVAGGGGLQKTIPARHYKAPSWGVVLRDIARDAGEAVSATASATVLGIALQRWTILKQPAGLAIRTLMELAGADVVWRLLPDGSIWVGKETWPDSGVASRVVSETPEQAVLELGLDDPWLLPGTTVDGRRVDVVEHAITAGGISTTAWTVPDGSTATMDRLKAAFLALAGNDPRAPYRGLYRGKIVKQSADRKRVDLNMSDPLLPPLADIPLKVGIPGASAGLVVGHEVVVAFEDGRADRPFACLWNDGEARTARTILQSASVELGAVGAVEQLILGTSYRGSEAALFSGLQSWTAAVAAAIAADPTMPAPNKLAVAAAQTALLTLFGQLTDPGAFLSSVSKTV